MWYGITIRRFAAVLMLSGMLLCPGSVVADEPAPDETIYLMEEIVVTGEAPESTSGVVIDADRIHSQQADTAADIQIDEATGLLYIMGVAGTAGNGSIVVTDAAAGDLTITLAAVETAKLSDKGRFWYDIQWLSAAGAVTTLTKGRAHIVGDVTRATS